MAGIIDNNENFEANNKRMKSFISSVYNYILYINYTNDSKIGYDQNIFIELLIKSWKKDQKNVQT